MNADPLVEKLSRFSPDASGLDRDALLFQAGRASAPPRRFWPAVAGILALSQAATLLYFLTRNPDPSAPVATSVPVAEPTTPAPDASREPETWSYGKPAGDGNGKSGDAPKNKAPKNMMVANQGLSILSIGDVLRDVDESASSTTPVYRDSSWPNN